MLYVNIYYNFRYNCMLGIHLPANFIAFSNATPYNFDLQNGGSVNEIHCLAINWSKCNFKIILKFQWICLTLKRSIATISCPRSYRPCYFSISHISRTCSIGDSMLLLWLCTPDGVYWLIMTQTNIHLYCGFLVSSWCESTFPLLSFCGLRSLNPRPCHGHTHTDWGSCMPSTGQCR